jgi:hypothetical protein
MRSTIRRVAAMTTLAVVALVFSQAIPADAHDYVEWGGEGCLHYLHRPDIGSLDYKIYSGSTTCDGDNNWAGKVKDDHATSDGYCVRAVLQGIVMTVSCDSGGSNLHFTDPSPQDGYAWTCITESNGSARCADNFNF